MSGLKKVLIVFPTDWDMKQLPACRSRWEDRFAIELGDPTDHDCPWNFDVLAYIERQSSGAREPKFDGVFSSSDYPGATTAAAIATRLGMPGSDPRAVIGASHKYYSRIAQKEAAPEASAAFTLVGPSGPVSREAMRFPCFIKPVKGAFSIMSERLDDAAELEAFLARASVAEFLSDYVSMFNELVAGLTDYEVNGSYFLAEELLRGRQVTLDGYVTDAGGEIGRLGIVDSIRDARTKSFVRFDYPTTLPRRVQERLWDVAFRVVRHIGLSWTLFNIEFMFDAKRDRVAIVEINPRMCGQFADLYEKVDGVSGYEVALALAVGEAPAVKRGGGKYAVASSYPMRIFEPSRVIRAPEPEEIRNAAELFDETLVWSECSTGDALDDFASEDGKSARYAVVNLGADDPDELPDRIAAVRRALDYRFEPCPPRGSSSGTT